MLLSFNQTQEEKDWYATAEPKKAFEKRLNYCLHLHTATQKALEYPDTKKDQYLFKKQDNEDSTLEDLLSLFEEEFF